MRLPILIAGAGSWGTALAVVLAENDQRTTLWGRGSYIQSLVRDRENRKYLPGVFLPPRINCTASLSIEDRIFESVVLAVPAYAAREVLGFLASLIDPFPPVCLVCKGLEPRTQLLVHEIAEDVLGKKQSIAILSGPSFAKEVASQFPTAVTITSSDEQIARKFAQLFHNDYFRIYTNDDVIGVAVAGAVKNVLAIAAGISDGLGFGANTRAALITRGLVEIMRLGVAMGGKAETFTGLSGLGDLVLTSTDDQSRNRRLGLALAGGKRLEEVCRNIGQAVEGVKTVREVCILADRLQIEMPISVEVLKVIDDESTPQAAVKRLLSRAPKSEQ